MPTDLLTRDEAARVLGVTPSYLANAAWRGDGPALVRLGHRTVRYSREALAEWSASRTVPARRVLHAVF